MSDLVSKSWFAVFNNPADHGYEGTPIEVCEKLKDEWIADSPSRTGAWAYCVSAEGLHHVHMVLEDVQAMRWSLIKKSYAIGMHFEPTKGTKQQAEDYINKVGKFEEKGESVLYICRHGQIKAASGQRSDLEIIETLINDGATPLEVMDYSLSYRRFEKMIRDAYFRKRYKETPSVREVKVHYITGEAGSGKSYTYSQLCDSKGQDSICFITDYENGGFDIYAGQPILFLDEYKGQLKFSTLLTVLDRYKSQVHARYTNAIALWDEVYITSVYPPNELYKKMVEQEDRGIDKMQQLLRRITDITYCWKDTEGNYQRYTVPMSTYVDRYGTIFDRLKAAAFANEAKKQGSLFYDLPESESGPLPF